MISSLDASSFTSSFSHANPSPYSSSIWPCWSVGFPGLKCTRIIAIAKYISGLDPL